MFRFAHGGKGRPRDKKGRFIARDYTLDTELPMHIGWTFDDEIEAIKKLHELGVKQADFHDVGWNIRGHDGRYPQLFPVEPALGGEARLREAIKTAKELGYQISCHTNNTDSYKIADCWSEDFVSRKADGSLVKGGVWSGGQSYIPCPEALYNRFIESDYRRIADLGYNGLHHVDVISAVMPRTCHDPKHPLNRKQWSEWQLKATKHAHDVFGGFTSECGVDHVAKYLDFSLYVSHYPRYLPHDNPLVDSIVPVWQIAYHGIILSNPFWECIAYTLQPPEEAKVHRLKLIEYGGRPCFYGGTNLKNLDKVKIAYDDFQPVKYLQLEFMDSHTKLTDGVFLTVYGDGSEVVANYTDKEFAYKGRKVAPVDYLLMGPTIAAAALAAGSGASFISNAAEVVAADTVAFPNDRINVMICGVGSNVSEPPGRYHWGLVSLDPSHPTPFRGLDSAATIDEAPGGFP